MTGSVPRNFLCVCSAHVNRAETHVATRWKPEIDGGNGGEHESQPQLSHIKPSRELTRLNLSPFKPSRCLFEIHAQMTAAFLTSRMSMPFMPKGKI